MIDHFQNPFGRSKDEDNPEEEEEAEAKTTDSAKESTTQQQKSDGLPGFLSGIFGG